MEQSRTARVILDQNSGRKENKIINIVLRIMVMGLCQAGLIYQMAAWFQLETAQTAVLGVGSCVITVCMTMLQYMSGKGSYAYIFAAVSAVILAAVKGAGAVYYGFFGMVNYMISWWNVSHEDAVGLVMESQITPDDIYSAVMVVLLLMTVLLWGILRRKGAVSAAVMVFVWVIPGLIVEAGSPLGCGLLAAGWLGVLMTCSGSGTGIRNIIWLVAASAVCILVTITAGGGKEQSVVELKKSFDESFQQFRYGDDTLPQGDLEKAAGLLNGDSETLEVTSEVNKDLYLRGFVGARYQAGKWMELSLADYKGDRNGMLAWLSDKGFMPVDQYSVYSGNDPDISSQNNLVTVKNVGASRRYVYTPYSADVPDGVLVVVNEDMNYLSKRFFGARNYEYVEHSGDRPGELLYAASWVKSPQNEDQQNYVEAENVYADFVYDTYLSVDSNMEIMLEGIFFGDGWESDGTIYSVTERIRDVLESRCVYKEQPEAAPAGSDPVGWFLNKGRQGNAVMYASAAVLAFRVQGIPARYVEGYRVPESGLAASSGDSVTLTNKNSHAWVEVYLDSVGWVPIDVTPGFYYDTYTLLQMVKRPQNVNQSAVNENSNDQGSELDNTTDGSNSNDDRKSKKISVIIPLDILVGLLLLVVCTFVFMELRWFTRRLADARRYEQLSPAEKIKKLSKAIFAMIGVYGSEAGLGWDADVTDDKLASALPGFYSGEYIRITEILEKSIYGEEELSQGEIRTLYIFADKLYQARRSVGLKTRLKIRYMM